MTFTLPSDADPGPVPRTPVPSSTHELTDQEFLGTGHPSGTTRATPNLSHLSDADLQAIAAKGSPPGAGGADLSSMSDEALRKIAGSSNTPSPDVSGVSGSSWNLFQILR